MPTRHDVRRLSLLKPTGHLTLGNYLGALRQMAAEQARATCFFGIADLHALTVPHDPARLRGLTLEMQAVLLACGLDPDRATLFLQSQVPAHSELSYLLESTAHTGELNRMIQFKEKGRGRPRTRVSLYTYPALMAADILLYRATEVPVGDDQRQHVELTRDLALRFNRIYGEVFTVPEITTPPAGARVMDLQDPTTKMGKSHTEGAGIIYLLDDPASVRRKVARAVTDSETGPDAVRHDRETKPGVSNLLEIVAACGGATPAAVAATVTSYGELKQRTTEAVLAVLEPLQERYAELADRPDLVAKVYAEGAERCRAETAPVLAAARRAMGLVS
ncbi:MAG TPA: tryptophan--tRNA ligase [Nocardioidaceae bacterium]|nr:tryptophan--tRNA ligase [Nocardioidaceae bacterium]